VSPFSCVSKQSDFTDNRPWRQLGDRDLSISTDVPDLESTGSDDRKRHRPLAVSHQDLTGTRVQRLQIGSQCRKVLHRDIGKHRQCRQLFGANGAHASPVPAAPAAIADGDRLIQRSSRQFSRRTIAEASLAVRRHLM
jgi:hypothetical protein